MCSSVKLLLLTYMCVEAIGNELELPIRRNERDGAVIFES